MSNRQGSGSHLACSPPSPISRRPLSQCTLSRSSTAPTLVFFVCLALTSMPLSAGGSSERVVIDRLVINGVNYTLVVTPSDSVIRDPHFGHSTRFEVHGTYRWLRGTLLRQEAGL